MPRPTPTDPARAADALARRLTRRADGADRSATRIRRRVDRRRRRDPVADASDLREVDALRRSAARDRRAALTAMRWAVYLRAVSRGERPRDAAARAGLDAG